MKPKNCKGTKTEFSYYVSKALQNRMPWKTLAMLLNDVAPTLDETREIISILLKELETLHFLFQEKQEELKKYQDKSGTNLNSPKLIHDTNVQESENQTLVDDDEVGPFFQRNLISCESFFKRFLLCFVQSEIKNVK